MNREEIVSYQKQLVEHIKIALERVDDIAHTNSIGEALNEMSDKFAMQGATFNEFGEAKEIRFKHRDRMSFPHHLVYGFSNDEFSFEFDYPELTEIRLDYSEDMMYEIVEDMTEIISYNSINKGYWFG